MAYKIGGKKIHISDAKITFFLNKEGRKLQERCNLTLIFCCISENNELFKRTGENKEEFQSNPLYFPFQRLPWGIFIKEGKPEF